MTEPRRDNPAYQVYLLLRTGFTLVPILFGLDKFFNWTVDWPEYLASWINDIVPGSAQDFMYFVGVVEIVAGLVVLVAPWIGGFLVAAWLGGIVVNLLTNNPPEYYDIALRRLRALPRRARTRQVGTRSPHVLGPLVAGAAEPARRVA